MLQYDDKFLDTLFVRHCGEECPGMKYIVVEDPAGVRNHFEHLLKQLPQDTWFELDKAAGAVGALQEYQGYVNGVHMGIKLRKIQDSLTI